VSALTAGELRPDQEAVASHMVGDGCLVDAQSSIAPLAGEWDQLERNSPKATVFQSRAWCQAWLEATAEVGLIEEVRLLTMRRDGRLVLLWPLAIRRAGPCRVLHAMGEPATQYCDLLIAADQDSRRLLAAAWSAIRGWGDIDLMEMRRVRADAAIAALPALAGATKANTTAAPFVDLRIAAAAAHRSSRTRNALRRHQRKLAEHGDVAFEFVKEPQAKIRVVDEAVVFKRHWMMERGLWSDGYAHAAADQFTRALAPQPAFWVSRMTVGGATAAVEAGYVMGATYWSLTQSYDPRFAGHAPGRLMMWQFIDHCVSAGIHTLDFLAPAHEYKRHWSTGEIMVADHLLPLTLKGSLLAAALGPARPILKGLYGRLPALVRPYAARLVGGRH
jgi:CelD/BcsL family acetyltransferase involved in cellulose biosynthesis